MGILPLVDYGTHSAAGESKAISWPYLVWPQLPMRSLSAQLTQKGPMDALLVSRDVVEVVDAVEYATQQAIVHSRLRADCIFIKQDGNLLVADFGVTRVLEIGAGYSKLTAGKGAYGMGANSAPAPEQILGQPVDTYTDVYALGAVLYRMLTGHRVFRGKSREEIIQQHLQAPVPSLATWRSDLPRELDDVIARAMAKDPARRFRQPGALANAYHSVVAPTDKQRVPFFTGAMPAGANAQASVERSARIDTRFTEHPYVRSAQSMPARISRRHGLGAPYVWVLSETRINSCAPFYRCLRICPCGHCTCEKRYALLISRGNDAVVGISQCSRLAESPRRVLCHRPGNHIVQFPGKIAAPRSERWNGSL